MTTVRLGKRTVGDGQPCYIVAEIGPNWCVSADRDTNLCQLMSLVDVAAAAGVDCVKLQLKSLGGFYASDDLTRSIDDPRSPFRTRGEFVRAREPDEEVLRYLDGLCAERGIAWTVSAWDIPSLVMLDSFDVPWLKVASASLTDHWLLKATAQRGKPVVLSTGMSSVDQIHDALEVLEAHGAEDVILAHCVSAYPLEDGDANLACIAAMREKFGKLVGYSGHERGLAITERAAALGACWVERHFTLDRAAWGPDHASSL